MVHIALCLQELLPFIHFDRRRVSKSSSFDYNFMKLGHNVLYQNVFLELDNGSISPYGIMSYWPLSMV